jgi:hypothetical protein
MNVSVLVEIEGIKASRIGCIPDIMHQEKLSRFEASAIGCTAPDDLRHFNPLFVKIPKHACYVRSLHIVKIALVPICSLFGLFSVKELYAILQLV